MSSKFTWRKKLRLLIKAKKPLRQRLLAQVPTEPGVYRDKTGSGWVLLPNGHWYDRHHITHHTRWNWCLGTLGLKRLDD